MHASKEGCQDAISLCDKVLAEPAALKRNSYLMVEKVKEFLLSAYGRIPSQAAIDRDRNRRKTKNKMK